MINLGVAFFYRFQQVIGSGIFHRNHKGGIKFRELRKAHAVFRNVGGIVIKISMGRVIV